MLAPTFDTGIITNLVGTGQRRRSDPPNRGLLDTHLKLMRRKLPILLLLATLVCMTGCSMVRGFTLRPYRINIQQGNYLEDGVFEFPYGLAGAASNHPGSKPGLIVGINQCKNFAQTENLSVNNGVHSQQLSQFLRRNFFAGDNIGIEVICFQCLVNNVRF